MADITGQTVLEIADLTRKGLEIQAVDKGTHPFVEFLEQNAPWTFQPPLLQRPFTIRAIATTADILRVRHTAKSRTWTQEADAYIAELPHPTPARDIALVRAAAEWLEDREEQQ